jgi:hypothetical protein
MGDHPTPLDISPPKSGSSPPPPPPPPDPPPADVNIPSLTYTDWLPDLDGTLPDAGTDPNSNQGQGGASPADGQGDGGTGASTDFPPPTVPAFRILPSSIRDAEKSITTPLKDAVDGVDGWHDLQAYIERVEHWIFYRPEEAPAGVTSTYSGNPDLWHAPPSQDALDAINYLDNLMLGGADSLMTVAAYLDRLNLAGQTYVLADKQSVFPDS